MRMEKIEEKLWFYDFEVTLHDWLCCIKNYKTKERIAFHNEPDVLSEFIMNHSEDIFAGYNVKGYDQYILRAVLSGFEPEEVKQVNDWIVVQHQAGWNYPDWVANPDIPIQMELMHDIVPRKSLKECEGNMCLPIDETTVDFNITTLWTPEELERMKFYCFRDVDASEALYELRKSYFQTKYDLLESVGLDATYSLSNTNANVVAMYLGGQQYNYDTTEKFTFPTVIDLSLIPQHILDFYENLPVRYNNAGELDTEHSGKLELDLFGCPNVLGAGGIHGALPNYFEQSTDERCIVNADGFMYYPSTMISFDLLSRGVTEKDRFVKVREQRWDAKFNPNTKIPKEKIPPLKLCGNTTFGCSGSKYNKLYDPMRMKQVCVWGQLFLIYLLTCLSEVPTLKSIQNNTDGVMFSVDRAQLPLVKTIIKAFEKQTGYVMEIDHIAGVWQRDVNNYIVKMENGKIKSKGKVFSALNKKMFEANSLRVVSNAVIEYFVNNTPVEKTITECDNIFDFQIIAKTGSTYQDTIHYENGEMVSVQKVNRIYAGLDKTQGVVKKVKLTDEPYRIVTYKQRKRAYQDYLVQNTDSEYTYHIPYEPWNGKYIQQLSTVSDCPECALIDNSNKLTIDKIDKSWYIEYAKKQITNFEGEMNKVSETTEKKTTKTKTTPEFPSNEQIILSLMENDVIKNDADALLTLLNELKEERENKQAEKAKVALNTAIQNMRAYIDAHKFEVDGYNSHQGYDYVKAHQYKTLLNKAALECGVGVHTEIDNVELKELPKSEKMHLVEVQGTITLYLINSPYTYSCYSITAIGMDNSDKGIYKAYTMLIKSFVQLNFLRSDNNENLDVDYEEPAKQATPAVNNTSAKAKVVEQQSMANNKMLDDIVNCVLKIREKEPNFMKGSELLDKVNDATLTQAEGIKLLLELEEKEGSL